MAKRYSDFDDQDQDGVFDQILTIVGERKKAFAMASVSAAVILLGLIVWGTYPDSDDAASNGTVPIVRADAGGYKTAPDNPGGMEIPYRDSTVFSTAVVGNNGPENILAEETVEAPMPKSQLFAGLNTEDPAAPKMAAQGEVEEVEAAMAPPPSNEALVKQAIGTASVPPAPALVEEKLAAAPVAKPEPVQPAKAKDVVAEKAAKTEPAAGASVAAKAVTPGGYYIQVGSVRAVAGTSGEWKKIQAKFPSQLGGLQFRTQEANLGDKGTFYRIQAGPMSKDSADRICSEMKAKAAGSCLVTK